MICIRNLPCLVTACCKATCFLPLQVALVSFSFPFLLLHIITRPWQSVRRRLCHSTTISAGIYYYETLLSTRLCFVHFARRASLSSIQVAHHSMLSRKLRVLSFEHGSYLESLGLECSMVPMELCRFARVGRDDCLIPGHHLPTPSLSHFTLIVQRFQFLIRVQGKKFPRKDPLHRLPP